MVNLEKVGCGPDKLKPLFENPDQHEKVKELIQIIRDRVKGGIDRNIADYRIYWAIDKAFDSPFYQVSYTQLQGLLDGKRKDDKEVLNQIRDWGLTHLLPDVVDKNGKVFCGVDGKPQKAINIPVFFNIFIPLVCAYVTIRWAKTFNDRNLVPLYKYEPAKFSKNNRLRCEIITELVQIMSTNFDYRSDERQAILQTLLYGMCFKFPRESWYQCHHEDSSGKKKLVKEGLRFNMPHPSRTYWDLFNRPSSINSNTGMTFAGYWEIVSYREVKNNSLYWNTDKISFGVNSWFTSAPDFLSLVYPCALSFASSTGVSTTQGAGALDSQNQASFYTNNHLDKGTLLTQHFEYLIPKDHGLSTYEFPLWFRFVMANDGAILWAEPLAYTPIAYYGYDADQNRSRNKSLALEVLPFQDLVSQIFSQWTLSTKQNLINPVFYNTDLVPEEIIRQLENMGEKMLRTRPFIPFSKTENIRLGEDHKEAFHAPEFTRHDTAQLSFLIKGVLDVLDRVLVLSSQEIGQSAPHEQTAEEVRVISHTTSTRLDFTGCFIDDGIYATKKMIYDALIAYGHEEINVTVSPNYGTEAQFRKLIDDLDLELVDESDADMVEGKVSVKGNKSSIELENFASTRDAANRIDNPGIAAAMAQIFQAVANNPVIIQVLGAQQLVDLLNQVIEVSGLPKEFKLKVNGDLTGSPEQQKAQSDEQGKALQELLLKFAAQIKESIIQTAQATEKKVMEQTVQLVEPVAHSVQSLNQRDQQQDAQIAQLTQAVQQVTMILKAAANRPAMAPQMQPPPPENGLPENIPPPAPAGEIAGLA